MNQPALAKCPRCGLMSTGPHRMACIAHEPYETAANWDCWSCGAPPNKEPTAEAKDPARIQEVLGTPAPGIETSSIKHVMPSQGVARIIKFVLAIKEVLALTCIIWHSEKDFMIQELEFLKNEQPLHTKVFLTAYQEWLELEYLESVGEREDDQS